MSKSRAGRDSMPRIGTRLRHRRLVLGLRLKQVAEKAGCSESLISRIENHNAAPSLSMLHRLVEALDTNISALLDHDYDTKGVVLRSGSRPVIPISKTNADETGIQLEPLVAYGEGMLLQANIHVIPVGAGSQGTIKHSGEEMGYVLQGSIELQVDNETYSLNSGDSFLFRSELVHGYSNNGDVVAKVIWINTPPTF